MARFGALDRSSRGTVLRAVSTRSAGKRTTWSRGRPARRRSARMPSTPSWSIFMPISDSRYRHFSRTVPTSSEESIRSVSLSPMSCLLGIRLDDAPRWSGRREEENGVTTMAAERTLGDLVRSSGSVGVEARAVLREDVGRDARPDGPMPTRTERPYCAGHRSLSLERPTNDSDTVPNRTRTRCCRMLRRAATQHNCWTPLRVSARPAAS